MCRDGRALPVRSELPDRREDAMQSDELLDALIKERMREWLLADKRKEDQPGPVVTISREPGCGGESIAERLAAELKLHLYSWEIVEQVARDAHVSAQVVATLDEKTQSEMEDWLGAFQGNRRLSSYTYFETLKRVIFAIAAHGSAVILGRGSNFFLPAEKRIGLCLVAPLEARIRNVMNELGYSEKRAQEHIAKLETEHRQLIKKYFNADIQDPTRYHLVVNTALVGPESIVRIVKGIIETGASNHRPST